MVERALRRHQHPDRNGQFEDFNRLAGEWLSARGPVLSVGTKKNELIGSYANEGTEWQPERETGGDQHP